MKISDQILPSVAAHLRRPPSNFIDGAYREHGTGERLDVFDPATGDVIAQVPNSDGTIVDAAVKSARAAFDDGRWRYLASADRERILLQFSALLLDHADELAQLETLEQGKSLPLARLFGPEAGSVWTRFAAGLATKITGRTIEPSFPGGPQRWTASTRREAVGVVAGIVPWNLPTLIALWKIAPALAAGCSIVIKPSETTPLTALKLAELAIAAGIPAGAFNVVTGTGSTTGQALTAHPHIAKISFTGSTRAGIEIGKAAMDRMARLTLELGGKNPAIVMKDADIEQTVRGVTIGAFANQGQVCAATSRVFVERARYGDLVDALSPIVRSMRAGPGLDPAAQVNPLASAAHQAKVLGYVDEARAAGTELIEGAPVPERGYYVAPMLALNPCLSARLVRDEIFGPVLSIEPVDSLDEAIARTNAGIYGLGASLWTRDLSTAMSAVPQIVAGTIWINSPPQIDPALPFGGYRQSGIGRDFGVDWLDAYLETKTICVSH
ncbi:MAG TPA: aldehyde dehydrogenase family protein [Steroidobacteraceae bacterium]|nr:aldehyde dehydrogenase family protein [Steroidobacteraceae bacterium]